MIFLDTNVISEPMRPKADPRVADWIKLNREELAISTVVLAEIAFGIERLKPDDKRRRYAAFLTETRKHFSGRVHGLDEESALVYGIIMGAAARGGHTAHIADGMIAAITIRHDATLATRNTRDFERLGVRVINPWG